MDVVCNYGAVDHLLKLVQEASAGAVSRMTIVRKLGRALSAKTLGTLFTCRLGEHRVEAAWSTASEKLPRGLLSSARERWELKHFKPRYALAVAGGIAGVVALVYGAPALGYAAEWPAPMGFD